ncbi:BRO family protein [Nostoc sp.]|uniref:BRO family protein n=1 Tax=Nostoc sp. TaxID=1180 RepID=UPI002FFB0672
MSKITLTNESANPFDQIKLLDADGVEYWLARDLMPVLGYNQWRRFEETIERASLACQNSGYRVDDHFADAGNVVKRQQGGGSRQSDYKLSRYACYLTAMNGDPRKSEIAAAQNYFAVKTREAELAPQTQELIEELLTKFEQQNQIIAEQGKAIALLQSQVQNLLPLPADFIPPGWDTEVWATLPPQDKRHFKYLYRRRGLHPGSEVEVKALPAANRELQRAEIEHLINDVPEAEKQLIETAKRVSLKRFWAKFGGES